MECCAKRIIKVSFRSVEEAWLFISFQIIANCLKIPASEYGLFLSDDDNKQGVWLESGRNLGYYLLRNHDVLEYRRKLRTLRVRMLDGAVKTILVDDSQSVSQLMVVICTKIGITNHEEYGLVREENDQQNENLPDNKTGTLTLRRKFAEKDRDAKMESLRKKLKTDDESKYNYFNRLLALLLFCICRNETNGYNLSFRFICHSFDENSIPLFKQKLSVQDFVRFTVVLLGTTL